MASAACVRVLRSRPSDVCWNGLARRPEPGCRLGPVHVQRRAMYGLAADCDARQISFEKSQIVSRRRRRMHAAPVYALDRRLRPASLAACCVAGKCSACAHRVGHRLGCAYAKRQAFKPAGATAAAPARRGTFQLDSRSSKAVLARAALASASHRGPARPEEFQLYVSRACGRGCACVSCRALLVRSVFLLNGAALGFKGTAGLCGAAAAADPACGSCRLAGAASGWLCTAFWPR